MTEAVFNTCIWMNDISNNMNMRVGGVIMCRHNYLMFIQTKGF